jgi:hypothetical protein
MGNLVQLPSSQKIGMLRVYHDTTESKMYAQTIHEAESFMRYMLIANSLMALERDDWISFNWDLHNTMEEKPTESYSVVIATVYTVHTVAKVAGEHRGNGRLIRALLEIQDSSEAPPHYVAIVTEESDVHQLLRDFALDMFAPLRCMETFIAMWSQKDTHTAKRRRRRSANP